MKNNNRIPQLTLELYYRGLATNKERKLVENGLESDSEVRKRYEALEKSEKTLQQLITQELKDLNIPERPPALPPRKKTSAILLIAAAVLLCALVPAILYLKSGGSNTDNPITEETIPEIKPEEGPDFIEEEPNKKLATPSEQPTKREQSGSNGRTELAENPSVDPGRATEPELRIEPDSGVSIAEAPGPDTGVQFRGGGQTTETGQPGTTAGQPESSNINIPPGITFIFDNMFANRGLSFVIIPARIMSIGKNAFTGNPLLSVTIGANVSMEDNAIPGNFAAIYNSNGKAAGTYTRPDVNSEAWGKK